MLGKNVKVHFVDTGLTNQLDELVALITADVHYMLYSCFPYINKKKHSYVDNYDISKLLHQFNHVIQDSGLFTLMFGAKRNQKLTYEDLVEWQDRLIQFVQENNIDATCVEVDAQKLIGAEKTWKLRERMDKLLKNRQIHVFHLEDGQYGLDRLIEYSDYIAISVPELRIHRRKTYVQDVHNLATYIKKKKPGIDIHLLGCTEFKILAQNTFCTSSDSNSWMQGIMFGTHRQFGKAKHISQLKRDLIDSYEKQILLTCGMIPWQPSTPKTYDRIKRECVIARSCKEQYALCVGDQE